MNYEAGLIAFLLIYVPMYFVYKNFKESNKRTDDEYNRNLK